MRWQNCHFKCEVRHCMQWRTPTPQSSAGLVGPAGSGPQWAANPRRGGTGAAGGLRAPRLSSTPVSVISTVLSRWKMRKSLLSSTTLWHCLQQNMQELARTCFIPAIFQSSLIISMSWLAFPTITFLFINLYLHKVIVVMVWRFIFYFLFFDTSEQLGVKTLTCSWKKSEASLWTKGFKPFSTLDVLFRLKH
jgi:hypothetical protein